MFDVRLCVVVTPQGKRCIAQGRRHGCTADTHLTGEIVHRFSSLGTLHALGAEAVRAHKIADSVWGISFVKENLGHFVAPQHSLCGSKRIGMDSLPTDITNTRAFPRL